MESNYSILLHQALLVGVVSTGIAISLILPVIAAEKTPPQKKSSCTSCHTNIVLDDNHQILCQQCHFGSQNSNDRKKAHTGLIFQPSHPDNVNITCGKCHSDRVKQTLHSLHFTVKKAVNLVRQHFGATSSLQSLTQIPTAVSLQSPLQLADDMLRRRCLRCHVYSSGDSYYNVNRGTGCAACHLNFEGEKLTSHKFLRLPADRQCQSCHYGNTVGAGYYGRFDHDFNNEYRTPYTTTEEVFRPYGVEYHQLSPDIHQQRGLSCIDCHSGASLMGEKNTKSVSCESCHSLESGADKTLIAKHTSKKHIIPQLHNQAHLKFKNKVACTVCHAQWSFNDEGTHLLLSMNDDFDPWSNLIIQGNSELEHLLENNINSDEDELEPEMSDAITLQKKPGIWYQGYTQRRWEEIPVYKDKDGVIKVFRPILNLHLSYTNQEDNVIFDNIIGNSNGFLPYTPHTTGPASLFFYRRFEHLLPDN